MAYPDSQFNVPIQETVVGGGPAQGVSLGTVTASATETYTGTAGKQVNGTYRFPVFKNPAKLNTIRVYCNGAAGNGVTGVTLGFYQGTNLIGSVTAPANNTWTDLTPGSPTLDSHGVLSTGNNFFTATSGELLMINTATGTGSGSALGSYSVDFIWQNLFTT